MARIRTIKPEFWTSSQVVECSMSARLAFVGMWNFCDDAGIHVADCRRLKMEVFPGDDITTADVQEFVNELLMAGLLDDYEVDGQKYWGVTGWRHQRIEKPTFKHPKRPASDAPSASNQRLLADSSPPEGKGMEGSLRDADGTKEGLRTAELSVESAPKLMSDVLDAYQEVHGVRPPGGAHLIHLIQQRIIEYPKAADPAWWRTYFWHTSQDAFLAGQKNPGFKADLQYLLKAEVFARVIEAAQRQEASHG